MLRTTIIRSTRATVARNTYVLSLRRPKFALQQLGFQTTVPPSSSKPPLTPEQQARKAALERSDDLQRDWDAKEILYDELKPMTDSPTVDTYLIDVREPDEVIQGMIPSAVNLPLSELADSLHLNRPVFLEKYGFEKPFRDQKIIFYCRSGKRSTTASDVAKRNGYTNILNYKGSWLEWVEKGNKL